MIAVSDLRIGNWVYDDVHTQFPMFVRTIGEDYVYLDFEGNEGDLWESTPDDVEGIPLTEELLEKIGFKLNENESKNKNVYSKRFKLDVVREIRIAVCIDCGSINVTDLVQISKGLGRRMYHTTTAQFFLHELQNFVFQTTKQELEVKL
jgi:hypothetical protein